MDDGQLVAWQLGRDPRAPWRVAARCAHGFPSVIATAPVTESGEPFPTLFYLTCPHLVSAVSQAESDGAIEVWRRRLATDADLAARLLVADAAYRRARAGETGGVDPAAGVGIAGQRDVLQTKCLHAHVAAYLGGIDDPLGEGVLAGVERDCRDRRCEELS